MGNSVCLVGVALSDPLLITAQLRYVVLHVDSSLARVLQHVITRGYARAIVVPARVLQHVITRGLPGWERVYT